MSAWARSSGNNDGTARSGHGEGAVAGWTGSHGAAAAPTLQLLALGQTASLTQRAPLRATVLYTSVLASTVSHAAGYTAVCMAAVNRDNSSANWIRSSSDQPDMSRR